MPDFDELDRTVREAIKAGRIGQPVFVRCVASVAPDGDAVGTAAQIIRATSEWIGSPVRRLYAVESPAPRQNSVSVEFADGAAALVNTTTAAAAGPTIDLIVLGNHGALYHETLAEINREGAAANAAAPGAAADSALRVALDKSLRSGQPQVLPAKEAP